MHLCIRNSKVKLDKVVFLNVVKSTPEWHMLFAMVYNLDALLNYFRNIGFLLLLVVTVGLSSMFRQTPNGSPGQIIGIQIDQLVKTCLPSTFRI